MVAMSVKSSAFNPAPLANDPSHQQTWDAAVVCLNLVALSKEGARSWIQRGWPDKLTPGMIARLQWPDSAEESQALAFGLLRDCMRGAIPAHRPERLIVIESELRMRDPIHSWASTQVRDEDRQHAYRVECLQFQNWLEQRKVPPSRHISAWFAANACETSTPFAGRADAAAEKENTRDRNARWLVVCDKEEANGPVLGAQTRAVRQISDSESMKECTVKRGIQTARKVRAESGRAGGARPVNPGIHPANDPFEMAKSR